MLVEPPPCQCDLARIVSRPTVPPSLMSAVATCFNLRERFGREVAVEGLGLLHASLSAADQEELDGFLLPLFGEKKLDRPAVDRFRDFVVRAAEAGDRV